MERKGGKKSEEKRSRLSVKMLGSKNCMWEPREKKKLLAGAPRSLSYRRYSVKRGESRGAAVSAPQTRGGRVRACISGNSALSHNYKIYRKQKD